MYMFQQTKFPLFFAQIIQLFFPYGKFGGGDDSMEGIYPPGFMPVVIKLYCLYY